MHILKISPEIGWVNLEQLCHAQPRPDGLELRSAAPQAVEAGEGQWSSDSDLVDVPAAEAVAVIDELDRLIIERS
jgi:hypothetical protein